MSEGETEQAPQRSGDVASRWRWVWFGAGALAVVGLVVSAIGKDTSELAVYVRAGERLLRGDEIYVPSELKTFTYPPFFAVVFLPFAWAGAAADAARGSLVDVVQRGVFGIWNVIACAWVLASLVRLVRPWTRELSSRRQTLVWMTVAVLAARPLLSVFQNQSHDFVILLLMHGIVVSRARFGGSFRAVAGGAFAGMAAACKATPALFLAPWLVGRRLGSSLSLIVTAAASTLVPDLVAPRADGQLYVAVWLREIVAGAAISAKGSNPDLWLAHGNLNQGLSGILYRLTHTPSAEAVVGDPFVNDVALIELDGGPYDVVLNLARLLVLALVVWPFVAGRPRSALGEVGELSVVACGMLLLSPMSSKSHFCLLIYPATYLAIMLARPRELAPVVRSVVAVLTAVAFGLVVLTTKGIVGSQSGSVLLSVGAVGWGTLALLLAAMTALVAANGSVRSA